MSTKPNLTSLGSVLSDASRVAMISALLDGRSLTAHELAHGAGVAPQTASFHLNKLTEAGLVRVLPQGRHRYFRLASPEIADTLKALMKIAPSFSAKPAARKRNAVCFARTCYGHLAGRVGIALAQIAEKKGYITRDGDEDFSITTSGARFLSKMDIDVDDLRKSRRRFASQCLDWSERQPHIGGALGFALTAEFKRRLWIKTKTGSRDVSFTRVGRQGLRSLLNIDVDQLHKTFLDVDF